MVPLLVKYFDDDDDDGYGRWLAENSAASWRT
jgi:hypothetical protein